MKLKFQRISLILFCLYFSVKAFGQSISGPAEVCPTVVHAYSYYDDVSYNSVNWSVTGGGTIVSGTGLSRSIRWSSNGTVTVQLLMNGTVTSQSTLNVSVYNPGTVSAATSVCSGSAITLTTSGSYGSNFVWQQSPDGGTTWNALGTSTTPSISASPTAQTSYRISSVNSCSRTASNVISVAVNPAPTIGSLTLTSSGAVCLNAGATTNANLSLSSYSATGLQWQSRFKDGSAGAWSSWTTYNSLMQNTNSASITVGNLVERYYEFRVLAQRSSCIDQISNTVQVIVSPNAAVGQLTVSPGTEFYSSSPALTLSVSSFSGNLSYESSTNGTTWSAATSAVGAVSQSTFFRARATTASCGNVTSASAQVFVYPMPSITLTGPSSVVVGSSTMLSVQNTYTSYQWTKENIDIPGASANSFEVKEPGTYRVKVKGSATAPWATSASINIGSTLLTQPQGINFSVMTDVAKEGFNINQSFYSLAPNEVRQTVQYMDGLGRTVQTVAIGQSPDRKDIVLPNRFNALGQREYNYLPYVASSIDGRFRPGAVLNQTSQTYIGSEQALFYLNGNLVAADNSPFSRTLYENAPTARVLEQGATGTAWQPGTGHAMKFEWRVNSSTATEAALKNIRRWTPAGPDGFYDDSQQGLRINVIVDENGNKVWSVSDRLGKSVLKRVQIDTVVEGVNLPFLETYYVYDAQGNLSLQIPPKAAAKLNAGSAWSTAFRDEWCFVYTYDDRNRLIEKKNPGSAPIFYIYDQLDRLVLTQDGNLRTSNAWYFLKYDVKGRPVMAGVYRNSVETTRAALQSIVSSLYNGTTWFEERGSTLHGYTNVTFPATNKDGSPLVVFSVNYFDNHDFDNNGTNDFTYTSQGISGEATPGSSYGLPTGSKRLILGTSSWLFSYVFYDKFGRVIQARSNNHLSATIDNLVTNVYDFDGTLRISRDVHKGPGGAVITTQQRMVYDHAGRVLKVFHSINGGAEVQVTGYAYNQLGQLIDKKLHSTNGIDFLQSVDYRYNIRGWLTSINNAQLSLNPANNDDADDYFGMEFLYNTMETGFNDRIGDKTYWNGNISAVKWTSAGAGSGTADQRAYKLVYDKTDRLLKGSYVAKGPVGWDKEVNASNEQMSYDANGNIVSLLRNENVRGWNGTSVTSTPSAIDNLTYTYASGQGNQLTKVEDLATAPSAGKGFVNGQNVATEYLYDAAGNLTADRNKGIDSVHYNELGKVRRVKFSSGKVIVYTYDGAGQRLTVRTINGTTNLITDYVGRFVYQNSSLSFFLAPEGRIIPKSGSFEYQYAIKDNLGNTRILFSSVKPAPIVHTATFEDNTQSSESSTFNNYPAGGNRSSLELFDHTDFSGSTYTRSNLLHGGSNSVVGIGKSFKVVPGDRLKIEAFAKYTNLQSGTSGLSNFAAALTSAFGVSSSSTGEAAQAFQALNSFGTFIAGGNTGRGSTPYPKAFVNIVLFDKDYKFLDAAWDQINGGEQVGVSVKSMHDLLSLEYVVKEVGYAYVYISNENPTLVDVYFDDVKLTHTPTNIIQYNEYYPFGLETDRSWTREGNQNNFLYNGGVELNRDNGWYETFFRGYDPAIARMLQVDPMADKYSSLTPYNYALNSPIVLNDPLGDDPEHPFQRLLERSKRLPSFNGAQDAHAGPSGSMFGGAWINFLSTGPSIGSSAGFWQLINVLWNMAPVNGPMMTWHSSDGSITYSAHGTAVLPHEGGNYAVRVFFQRGRVSVIITAGKIASGGGFVGHKKNGVFVGNVYFEWDGEKWSFGGRQQNEGNSSAGSSDETNWLKEHLFWEIEGDLSVGPQATLTYPLTVVPYTPAAGMAVKINLYAVKLLGFKVNNRGTSKPVTPTDFQASHAIGLSFHGTAVNFWEADNSSGTLEHKSSIISSFGFFGIEINWTQGSLFIGAMPQFDYGAGGALSLKAKAGLMFD